jgi:uncharacterized LabA/DUF88 family protein
MCIIKKNSGIKMKQIKINQNVAILCDGNNIEISIHEESNNKGVMINFDTLIPKLLNGRGLNRLIYFREGKSISDKFAERLHTNYYGSVIPCHKTADIPLSIKATQLASKVDTIIIMSGDSDYIELVRHLKAEGVRVEIAAVVSTTSNSLIREADYFHPITKDDWFAFGDSRRNKSKFNKSSQPSASATKFNKYVKPLKDQSEVKQKGLPVNNNRVSVESKEISKSFLDAKKLPNLGNDVKSEEYIEIPKPSPGFKSVDDVMKPHKSESLVSKVIKKVTKKTLKKPSDLVGDKDSKSKTEVKKVVKKKVEKKVTNNGSSSTDKTSKVKPAKKPTVKKVVKKKVETSKPKTVKKVVKKK